MGIGIWVGTANTKIEALQNRLKTVQEDIKKLLERLPLPKTADSSSPLNLKDFGQKNPDHVDARE
ncbi:MAG: hypothetical protein OXF73_02335 [Gammaproteobacteria bacterium]|nr:hypothetical protein [Gammaproteobacteria bacterium]